MTYTLDAHQRLASAVHLPEYGRGVPRASYDHRMLAVAGAMTFPIHDPEA